MQALRAAKTLAEEMDYATSKGWPLILYGDGTCYLYEKLAEDDDCYPVTAVPTQLDEKEVAKLLKSKDKVSIYKWEQDKEDGGIPLQTHYVYDLRTCGKGKANIAKSFACDRVPKHMLDSGATFHMVESAASIAPFASTPPTVP